MAAAGSLRCARTPRHQEGGSHPGPPGCHGIELGPGCAMLTPRTEVGGGGLGRGRRQVPTGPAGRSEHRRVCRCAQVLRGLVVPSPVPRARQGTEEQDPDQLPPPELPRPTGHEPLSPRLPNHHPSELQGTEKAEAPAVGLLEACGNHRVIAAFAAHARKRMGRSVTPPPPAVRPWGAGRGHRQPHSMSST